MTDEDERILDAAAARRWHERPDPNLAAREQGGDQSIKLTEEDERALDLAWAKVRERRPARAAAEKDQAPPTHAEAVEE